MPAASRQHLAAFMGPVAMEELTVSVRQMGIIESAFYTR